MGIQATVVYDVVRHEPVVVRGSSSNATSTATLADTIASFSEHITLNQGKAKTPVELCALWGGPPYITYVLVRKRFRVIVIWDEEAGELDTGYDVHYCLSTLQRAVGKQAAALAEGDTTALAAVYEVAGHALLGGDDEYVDSKTVANDVALDETIAAGSTPTKKKGGLRKLWSKTLKSGGKENNQSSSKFPKIRTQSKKEVATPAAPEVSKAMSDSQLETAESKLLLAPQVFNWADFGGELTKGGGDIAWIADLLRGDERRVTTAAPVFREDNADMQKLNSAVPASVEPIPSVAVVPTVTAAPTTASGVPGVAAVPTVPVIPNFATVPSSGHTPPPVSSTTSALPMSPTAPM